MIVGIDLGTTNSLIAYYTDDGARIIPNRLGSNLTPSVVAIDEEGQVLVGETAKEYKLLYPDSGASVFKRHMGSNKKYNLSDKEFTAEELSSFVLRALKEDAEAFLGEEVTEAVISVPAYFNDARRKATKTAGELAGLKVERIISEPTAAAIAYGLCQDEGHARYLVFDLGGGTFDVSILELIGNILEVHAVAGDNFLGGEDFTRVIEDEFYKKNELDRDSLGIRVQNHIHKQAELAKKQFTDAGSITMSCNIDGKIIKMDMSLLEYEGLCQDILEKLRAPIKRSLADAHIKLSGIDNVVLVGGATKSPVVRHFVSKLFKRIPSTNINPDEAVALGAATQAAIKERKEALKEVILTDVCPFTLGVEVVREWQPGCFERGIFSPVIERNTVIPASRTDRLYTTHDNQNEIRVNVLQGESRLAANNLSLGEIIVKIPLKKAGEEAIDITYTYDVNSILDVEVKVVSTKEVVRKVFKGVNVNMTDEEIEARFAELAYLKIHPRDREENKLLRLKAERMYEESLGDARLIIEDALHKFEFELNSYDSGRIDEARKELKKVLSEIEEFEI